MHQPRDSAVFFSKQTATATAGGRRASVEQVGTGGEGRRRGEGSNSHSAPLPSLPACATPLAGSPPHDTAPPPPPPLPPKPHKQPADTAVKGRRGEGSSTQLNTFTLCSPHFRPPVYSAIRCEVAAPRLRLSSRRRCRVEVPRSFPFVCMSRRSEVPFALSLWRSICSRRGRYINVWPGRVSLDHGVSE